MMTLACKDIGLAPCEFVARGETIHEVLEKMVAHISERHLEEWAQKERRLDLENEKNILVKNIKDNDMSPV